MNKFGFIIHPLALHDVQKKFKLAEKLPDSFIARLLAMAPAFKLSEITGVTSKAGQTAEGCFVVCPLTSEQMLHLPTEWVLKRIIQAGRVAEKQGVKIVGLGAFTSVVGDAGRSIAKQLKIAVTTGNSYTVAMALEGITEAARLMQMDLSRTEVVIVGATGSIGRTCAHILARSVKYLTLVGRDERALTTLATSLLQEAGIAVNLTTDVRKAVKRGDIILTVTGAVETLIEPEDLKCGCIVCDVARPRDVSPLVAKRRDDVLVIEGGIVEVPGEVDFHFDFGFPERTAYACMAETMILALEGRYENFTLGREIGVQQVEEISKLAKKHGFSLAGLRSFERALELDEIVRIREKARDNLDKKLGLVYN